jgi:hypothetical protein
VFSPRWARLSGGASAGRILIEGVLDLGWFLWRSIGSAIDYQRLYGALTPSDIYLQDRCPCFKIKHDIVTVSVVQMTAITWEPTEDLMGPLAFHISHFIETHSIFMNLFEQGIDGQVRWYGNSWPHDPFTRLRILW